MQWKCGDSFFTKYSSCSFDRAVSDPNNLLNPLHPSITPCGVDGPTPYATVQPGTASQGNNKHHQAEHHLRNLHGVNATPSSNDANSGALPSMDTVAAPAPKPGESPGMAPTQTVVYARDAKTGQTTATPLSEVGKASRFGDKTLMGSNKCNVFEVVLQRKEVTICPACARSPRRARLPAHARGCFGLS